MSEIKIIGWEESGLRRKELYPPCKLNPKSLNEEAKRWVSEIKIIGWEESREGRSVEYSKIKSFFFVTNWELLPSNIGGKYIFAKKNDWQKLLKRLIKVSC